LIESATSAIERNEYQESLESHLEQAKSAREYYKTVNINRAILHDEKDFMCLSFDWGQNWDIPRYLKHPGELYFLSRQRVGLFCITNEKKGAQSFYWIAKKDLIGYGKGPNSTISYLYDYLIDLPVKPKKLV